MTIMMKVNSQTDYVSMIWELHSKGLLNGIDIEEMSIPAERFPVEVPINLDAVLDLAAKPVMKPFRKKIDETLTKNILKVKEGLC